MSTDEFAGICASMVLMSDSIKQVGLERVVERIHAVSVMAAQHYPPEQIVVFWILIDKMLKQEEAK